MQNTPDISLIIPLLNEEESLLPLHKWILDVFNKDSRTYEVIFIDDGSSDNSWNVISTLTQKHLNMFGIKFVKNYGKSQALHAGFAIAKGNYIVTLDSDLQDSPEEIPRLVDALSNQKLDLIQLSFNLTKTELNDSLIKVQNQIKSLNKRQYLYNLNYTVSNGNSFISPLIAINEFSESDKIVLDTIKNSMSKQVLESKYGKIFSDIVKNK